MHILTKNSDFSEQYSSKHSLVESNRGTNEMKKMQNLLFNPQSNKQRSGIINLIDDSAINANKSTSNTRLHTSSTHGVDSRRNPRIEPEFSRFEIDGLVQPDAGVIGSPAAGLKFLRFIRNGGRRTTSDGGRNPRESSGVS